MKNTAITALLALTLAFAAFVAGLYVGRNYDHSVVQISGVPTQGRPGSTEPATTDSPTTVPATLDATTLRLVAALNAATLEDWDAVPNIGEATAKKILDYRSTYGDFERPEDLLHVNGIGEKTLQNIIEHFLGRLDNEDPGRG